MHIQNNDFLMNKPSFSRHSRHLDNNGKVEHNFYYLYDNEKYDCYLELFALDELNGNFELRYNTPEKSIPMKSDKKLTLTKELNELYNSKFGFAYRFRLNKKGTKELAGYAFDNGDVIGLVSKKKNGKGEVVAIEKDNRPDYKFNVVLNNRPIINKNGPMQLIMPDEYNPVIDKNGNEITDREALKDMKLRVRTHANKLGGNLQGIIAKIPSLKDENIKRIVGTPFTKDVMSSHHYWTENAFQISPELGSEKDFKKLQVELFKNDINWIADAALVNEGLGGIHINSVLRHPNSFFSNFFKGEGEIKLGLLPNDSNEDETKQHTKMKLINAEYIVKNGAIIENKEFKKNKPTYIQLYDDRLASEKQIDSTSPARLKTYDYKNTYENPKFKETGSVYDITKHDDAVYPFAFEVDPKKLTENLNRVMNSANKFDDSKSIPYEAIKNVTKFEAFNIVEKSEAGGLPFWDGNVDIAKLNFFLGPEDYNNGKNIDAKTQGALAVKYYSINSGKYWTKLTTDEQVKYIADALCGNISVDNTGNEFDALEDIEDDDTHEVYYCKVIKTLVNNGMLPESALNIIDDKINNKSELIRNVINDEYQYHLRDKGEDDLIVPIQNCLEESIDEYNEKKEKINAKKSLNEYMLRHIINTPIETLPVADNLMSVLSSPYIVEFPYNLEEMKESRYHLATKRLQEKETIITADNPGEKTPSEKIKNILYERDRQHEEIKKLNPYYKTTMEMFKLYEMNADFENLKDYCIGNLIDNVLKQIELNPEKDKKNENYDNEDNEYDEDYEDYEDYEDEVTFYDELQDKDGLVSEYGRYVINELVPDLTKYFLIKGFDKDAKIIIDDNGNFDFSQVDSEKITLQSLGIELYKEGMTEEEEAKEVIKALDKGLSEFYKEWRNPNSENGKDRKKLLEKLGERFRYKTLEDYKIAELIHDRTESGLGWRIDAAKDIVAINSVRNGGVADMQQEWNKVIEFWKDYNEAVLKINPHAYTTVEFTDLDELFGYNANNKFYCDAEAERNFLEQTGITSVANYNYFFSMLPELFNASMENGNEGWKSSEEKSRSIVEKLILGWDNGEDKRKNPGFLFQSPEDGIINSYTFVGNHDKPRVLHGMALDMQLFHGGLKNPDHQKIAKEVIDPENKLGQIDYDKYNSHAIAMGYRINQAIDDVKEIDNQAKKDLKIAVSHLAQGNFTAKNKSFDPEAFGTRPFEVNIRNILEEAKYSKTNKDLIEAKLLQNILEPAFDRYLSIYKMLVTLPGSPTDFAGDRVGATGYETKTKNYNQQNRNTIHWEWLKDDKFKFVKDFNNKMKEISNLRTKKELSALNNGSTVVLPIVGQDSSQFSEKMQAILRYNDEGSIVISLYDNVGANVPINKMLNRPDAINFEEEIKKAEDNVIQAEKQLKQAITVEKKQKKIEEAEEKLKQSQTEDEKKQAQAELDKIKAEKDKNQAEEDLMNAKINLAKLQQDIKQETELRIEKAEQILDKAPDDEGRKNYLQQTKEYPIQDRILLNTDINLWQDKNVKIEEGMKQGLKFGIDKNMTFKNATRDDKSTYRFETINQNGKDYYCLVRESDIYPGRKLPIQITKDDLNTLILYKAN